MRTMLMPKWWLLHFFVLAAVLVMLRLGLWQWHRANSPTGGIQNYAYAFQWPLFAVFAIVLWAKTLHEEARRDPEAEAARLVASPGLNPDGTRAEVIRQPGLRVGISATPTPDADDAEVTAWNARLAALSAATAAVEGRRR